MTALTMQNCLDALRRLPGIICLLIIPASLIAAPANAATLDETINTIVQPATDILSSIIFYSITVFGAEVPLIVVWLIFAACYFTLYFGFINVRGFAHAISIVAGGKKKTTAPGEVSHFQALATAVSGTVGIGNIAGVAVSLSLGGAGAVFWLIMAGFVGMTTKFVECTLGVKYREIDAEGHVSGGPMHYLHRGFAKRGWGRLGRFFGLFYAASIVIGCLGIGNMFQSNQAFAQLVFISGGEDSALTGNGWAVGAVMAVIVGLVIIGGIKRIAQVTDKIVPFMIVIYMVGALIVILLNIGEIPGVVSRILAGAFTDQGLAGGFIGVMIIGFQRAAFSNEAGLGSASIAHSAVRTDEPLTEGFVAMLEPFIDTVVVCTLTALVILVVLPNEQIIGPGLTGIEMTSTAFGTVMPWAPVPLSIIAFLFAFSTMIAWAYYGQKGWRYLVGDERWKEHIFGVIFCAFIVLGASIQLEAVLDFADALIFVMAIPNLIGLYVLAPEIKADLQAYLKADAS